MDKSGGGGKRQKQFANFGEYFYWAYANFQMLHYALGAGKKEYDRQCFMVRAKAYKAYCEGRWKPHDLYDFNKAKMLYADKCWYCGKEFAGGRNLTLDHVFPRSKGGDSAMDNLVPVCQSCNSSKGRKDVLRWFAERDLFPPLHVIVHYYKQIYLYAAAHDLFGKHRDELRAMSLPFDVDAIITHFPSPTFFSDPEEESET